MIPKGDEHAEDLAVLGVGQRVGDICCGVSEESSVEAMGPDRLHNTLSTRFILARVPRAADVPHKLCSLAEDEGVEHTEIGVAV